MITNTKIKIRAKKKITSSMYSSLKVARTAAPFKCVKSLCLKICSVHQTADSSADVGLSFTISANSVILSLYLNYNLFTSIKYSIILSLPRFLNNF